MIRSFIIYPLSHTILVVDVSEIGSPRGIYPPEGELKMVPTYRFHNWRSAEIYLAKIGIDATELAKRAALVAKGTINVLTVVCPDGT